MVFYVKSSGALVSKNSLSIRSSGSTVAKSLGFKKVAGVLVAFMQSLVRLDSWTQSNVNPTQSTVEIVNSPQGHFLYQVNGANISSYDWALVGSYSDYQYRTTVTAGALVSGGTSGSWEEFSSFGNIGLIANAGTGNNKSVTFTLDIRQKSTGYILASGTFILSATYT